jgi:butyryl-CoA dehydrogenase
MLYEMCRKFADEVLAPNAGKWDKTHTFPKEAIQQLVCFSQTLLPNSF